MVESVKEMGGQHVQECVSLANKTICELANVLAMLHGKYYDFGECEREFFVFEQADNVDNTPVHNLQMDCQCGDTDHRLKKKPNLNTGSRGNILKETRDLRKTDSSGDFRKMEQIDKLTVDWNARQKSLRAVGLSKKESALVHTENRKLTILERLKKQGGSFTSVEQIDTYLHTTDNLKVKAKRMQDEVTYARDASVSLPRTSTLFKIFGTEKGQRKLLTPESLGKICVRVTACENDHLYQSDRV